MIVIVMPRSQGEMSGGRARSAASSASAGPLGSLREHVSKFGVVLVPVHVMNPDVPV